MIVARSDIDLPARGRMPKELRREKGDIDEIQHREVAALAHSVGGGNDATSPAPNLSNENGPKGKNATVRVTPKYDTLNALHETVSLAANVDVTWTSLTPAVTTVDASGHVVAVGSGLGLIQALSVGGQKTDTTEIVVRELVAAMQVTPDALVLSQGSVDTLTAVVSDANGYPIIMRP